MWDHRDWIVGGMAVIAIWLQGDKNKWGWVISFVAEILWITLVIQYKLWGLIPCSLLILYIDIRNFIKWTKEEVFNVRD